MAEHAFTRQDLLSVWLEYRRYEQAHDDLRGFHGRRLQALQAAFGVDLVAGTGPAKAQPPDWLMTGLLDLGSAGRELSMGRPALRRLFERATDGLLRAGSPFAGFLEAPPVVVVLHERHRPALDAAAEAVRRAHRQLLLDLLELLWGLDETAAVTLGQVRAHGWDPDQEAPDPDDYW